MSNNKVTYGLEKVHIAFMNESNTLPPTWETPIPIPGAVRWTPSAVGESSSFFADNHAYFVVTNNNGYTGELELALLPDALTARILGWLIDDNGMLVEVADATPAKFALLGQIQGDQKNRRFVYYDSQAARPAKERKTKGESIEVATDIFAMTVSPIEIGGRTMVKGDLELSDTNTAAYTSFFNTVYIPTFGVVDKTNLIAAIALAGTFDEAEYTVESWDNLTSALASATAVNTNVSAVQPQVDVALRELNFAIVGLVVL